MAHIPGGEYGRCGLSGNVQESSRPTNRVLKLLLTEVYASEPPARACLSLTSNTKIVCQSFWMSTNLESNTSWLYRDVSRLFC